MDKSAIIKFATQGYMTREDAIAAGLPPEQAEALYEHFVQRLKTTLGDANVATGVFRAMMDVELVNDGPVTVLIESKDNT